jgi:hypothetical protein
MNAAPELEFNAEAWNDMASAERVRRCMIFAHEANRHALNAAPDVREAYAELARQWLTLAAEIEKNSPAAGRSS